MERIDTSKPSNITTVNGKEITPNGFNLTDATLDEKMEYLQSLFKKMNT